MARPTIRDFDLREADLERRPQPRNGMLPDGSYSASRDYDKMLGNAIAEYDARRKDPRTSPYAGGGILDEDKPENLRRELLDPLMPILGSAHRSQQPVTPRTYKITNESGGNSIVSTDPITGATRELYSVPGKSRANAFDIQDHRSAIRNFEKASEDVSKAQENFANEISTRKDSAKAALDAAIASRDEAARVRDEVRKKIEDATRSGSSSLSPDPLERSPESQKPKPYGFVSNTRTDSGLEIGENAFESKPSKNGRLPRSLAAQLLKRANGDRKLAEQWAIEAGYSVE